MASDNENQVQDQQDQQEGIWNCRLKSNSKEAKFYLEFIDALGSRFDGMPIDDIMQTFFGESRDILEKSIKKANKRQKKAVLKFNPEGLKKPSNPNILFQRDFKAKCEAKNIKYEQKSCLAAYKALSEKDKQKYIDESTRLKAEYKVEYERLRAAAIKSGAFPADKPKKPMTAYFRYLQEVREELKEKYADDEDRKGVNKKIAKDCADMWKNLSEEEKQTYEAEYRQEKEEYEQTLKNWEANETSRRKGQSQSQSNGSGAAAAAAAPVEPIKIESSGTDKRTKAKTQSEKQAEPVAPAPVVAKDESADEGEKPKKAARVPAKAAASESEQEEEIEAPVIKSKAKATKPKSK